MSLPTVAIVGRPNVGKSSLFNRILRRREAVVDPTSGVTRDRHYETVDWIGVDFRLVDTGGMVPDSPDLMEQAIFEQSDYAIHEADLILLVADVQTGADQTDIQIARMILKSGKPVILAVNKVDNESFESDVHGFYSLGIGDPLPISATGGLGIAELLDEIVRQLPESDQATDKEEGVIRVSLVGRPNVGKSSFINKLLGENRHIVSDIAGTTRDSIDTPFEFENQKYMLVDTAGLRRKYKVHENIEFYTSLRTVKAVENCDVAVVLIEADKGITSQDQRILAQVAEVRRAAVLVVNKWDLVEKDNFTYDNFMDELKREIPSFTYIPVVTISALSGQRVHKVLPFVKSVYQENNRRIPTSKLNEFLEKAYSKKKPPARNRKYIQFKYVTQSEIAPPTFVFFTSHPDLIDRSYMQYLTNQLRATFGFQGVPIRLKCRKK